MKDRFLIGDKVKLKPDYFRTKNIGDDKIGEIVGIKRKRQMRFNIEPKKCIMVVWKNTDKRSYNYSKSGLSMVERPFKNLIKQVNKKRK